MSHGELCELTWKEVEDAAEDDPEIWYGEAEFQWIKLAWEKLTEVGATRYVTGMERTQTIIKFLSLLKIYRDFRCLVLQESCGPDYYEWAQYLEISPFRVGQLIGLASQIDDEDDLFAFSDALDSLAHGVREDIVKSLLRAFRGRFKLFNSLWDIHLSCSLTPYERIPQEDDQGLINLTPSMRNFDSNSLVRTKKAALVWVMRNCPTDITAIP